MTDGICDRWITHSPGVLWRADPTGEANGYVLREGVPRNGSGQLSSRLPPDWRVFEASGIRCWWRVDSADGQWMPAGDALVRSSQHVGFHVCARELLARGHDVGPCSECVRIQKRAEAFR